MHLEVYCDDYGDVLSEPEFKRINTMRLKVFDAVLKAYGEFSSDYANVLIGYAAFLERNGRGRDAKAFQESADEILAKLEGAQS
jgi:hypothetical protein